MLAVDQEIETTERNNKKINKVLISSICL